MTIHEFTRELLQVTKNTGTRSEETRQLILANRKHEDYGLTVILLIEGLEDIDFVEVPRNE